MRIVVIDAYTKTVTDEQVSWKGAVGPMHPLKEVLRPGAGSSVVVATTVENGATGDRFYMDRSPPHDAPPFKFLGDEYRGRGVIVGRDLNVDAAVPLARVKKQVSF